MQSEWRIESRQLHYQDQIQRASQRPHSSIALWTLTLCAPQLLGHVPVKLWMGSGTPSPVASTGMSSYASKSMPVLSAANRPSASALRALSAAKGSSSRKPPPPPPPPPQPPPRRASWHVSYGHIRCGYQQRPVLRAQHACWRRGLRESGGHNSCGQWPMQPQTQLAFTMPCPGQFTLQKHGLSHDRCAVLLPA